uniref:Uncharacterized protein n=1 Tax=Romanomermis culicivorax TaxID=13658 RepID=A0A915HII8_ROMCU
MSTYINTFLKAETHLGEIEAENRKNIGGDAKTKPEDYGSKTAATTVTASWQDEGFFSSRTGIIALSVAIVYSFYSYS